jgi:hypothetical protein
MVSLHSSSYHSFLVLSSSPVVSVTASITACFIVFHCCSTCSFSFSVGSIHSVSNFVYNVFWYNWDRSGSLICPLSIFSFITFIIICCSKSIFYFNLNQIMVRITVGTSCCFNIQYWWTVSSRYQCMVYLVSSFTTWYFLCSFVYSLVIKTCAFYNKIICHCQLT